jgi:hypothetical protein
VSVGLPRISLAVLAWLRMAAVSSRRGGDEVGLGRLLGLSDLGQSGPLPGNYLGSALTPVLPERTYIAPES